MQEQAVDIADWRFWLVLFLAILLLVPSTDARWRRTLVAGVNLFFLGLFLSWRQFATVLGGVLLVNGLLKIIEGGSWRRLTAGLFVAGLLFLFLLHKLPSAARDANLQAVNPVLVVLGFSYVALRMIEVWRAVLDRRHPAPDLVGTVNYLLPFHMLVAGPIQSYDDFVKQLPVVPPLTRDDVLRATERITWGLVKKFVLAFSLQQIFLTGFRSHGWYFVLEAQIFFIWLYLDFSALSDLAAGIGRLLGLATPENFNRPYLARNMIDFWERWHISLSEFIRRNLFIPLQLWLVRGTGARFPLLCASVAFTVSFMLCGLWHGLALSFFLWGTCHALGLVITNLYRSFLTRRLGAKGLKNYLKSVPVRIVATAVTFEFVAFSLVPVGYPWDELWK